MAKAITVFAGTAKEGFSNGLCECVCERCQRGFVTPISGPWFFMCEWTRHCLRPAPAAATLRTRHLSLAEPFQCWRHNDSIHISFSQESSNNLPYEHTQRLEFGSKWPILQQLKNFQLCLLMSIKPRSGTALEDICKWAMEALLALPREGVDQHPQK